MKCHAQKNDKSNAPKAPASRRNTISEGVAPQPSQNDFDINSPSALVSGPHTGIPLMQILSPSNYLPPQGNDSTGSARHSIDVSNPFLDSATSQSNILNMQLPGTSWTVPSPINGMNKTSHSSHTQKPSPSQNSGGASTFETSVTTPGNPVQTPRSEIVPESIRRQSHRMATSDRPLQSK